MFVGAGTVLVAVGVVTVAAEATFVAVRPVADGGVTAVDPETLAPRMVAEEVVATGPWTGALRLLGVGVEGVSCNAAGRAAIIASTPAIV